MNKRRDTMRRTWLAIGLTLAVAALAAGAIACGSSKKSTTDATATPGAGDTPAATEAGNGSPGNAQSEVSVTLVEYQVKTNVESVPSGSVTFEARNIGGAEHALHVFKTDLAPDALPTMADGSVDEEAAGLTMVDHVTGIQPQQSKSLTLDLEPGTYVLVCNVVQQTADGQTISHYEKGMHVAFTITE
jgi:hypothetical protein